MAFDRQTFQEIFGVSAFDENQRRVVKGKILARWFDEAATPLLWLVLSVAFVCCASDRRLFDWLLFASTIDFVARFWRESYGVWREYPYWRSVETTRASSRSVSLPFWTINAILLALLLVYGAFSTFLAVACFLIFVDRFFAIWTRRFAEKTIRAGVELWRANDDRVEKTRVEPVESTEQNEILSLVKSEKRETSARLLETPIDASEEEGTVISCQQRTRTADGAEQITGEALVEFREDADVEVVNVAFCPSFKGVPTFEYEQVSGVDVAIKTTLIQPFGVRLEVRRRNASVEDEPTRLEFFARYPPRE